MCAADAFGKQSLYDELIKINHYPHFHQRHDNVYNQTANDLVDKSKACASYLPLLNNTVASLHALLHATTFSRHFAVGNAHCWFHVSLQHGGCAAAGSQ